MKKQPKNPAEFTELEKATELGRKKGYCFRLSGITINQLDCLVRASIASWQLSPLSVQPTCNTVANRSVVLRQVIQDAYDAQLSQHTRGERLEHVKKKSQRKRPR